MGDRPELRTIPDVELVKAGEWPASTGDVEITAEDLQAAVAAAGSPSVRKPVLKLGHTDPRFDGEPAVGWVDNLRLSNDGLTLLGDLRGVPSWLADIMPSAYPDRSIEGQFNVRDQTGKVHGFALTGLALLGVSPPAVGTLKSLQDVAGLYGLGDSPDVKFTVSEKANVVNLSSAVTSEDVRRSFYDSGPGSEEPIWLVELFVDPTEAIAESDNGELFRVPFTVGDDSDSIDWGELQAVKREYVAASASSSVVKFSVGEAEKRGVEMDPMVGLRKAFGLSEDATKEDVASALVAASQSTVEAAEVASDESEETSDGTSQDAGEREPVEVSAEQWKRITDALELDEDAPVDDVVSAVEKLAEESDEGEDAEGTVSASAHSADEDTVVLDKARYDELVDLSARGEQANAEAFEREAESQVDAAIGDGRLGAASRERWLKRYKDDPEDAKARLSAMATGRIPRTEMGRGGSDIDIDDEAVQSENLTARAKAAGFITRPQV